MTRLDQDAVARAATVVLLRDAAPGLELLMLRRNSHIAFGGMWVFPGGRVDEDDRAGLAPGDHLGSALRAAVREAVEETELVVEPESLVPYSHWTPPAIAPKRFLTWFFLARAPAGDVAIDRGEIHDHAWMRPAEALRRRDQGEIELAPPTFVTLSDLARFDRLEAALESARGRDPEHFETRVTKLDGEMVILWHGDAGYEEGRPERPGARHRLFMARSGWRYERAPAPG